MQKMMKANSETNQMDLILLKNVMHYFVPSIKKFR